MRDIFDGFEVLRGDGTPTLFPAFWGHDAKQVITLTQQPNAYLEPLSKPRKGRPLRNANLLWSRAGQILIAERMGLSTQRLPAVFVPERVLSASWWPLRLQEDLDNKAAKALVLWLNSTPSILLFVGSRVETHGAWTKFKKPTLHALPVLDVRQLTQQQLKHLADIFDRLSEQPLQPLSQLADDPVRKAIDDAVSEALGLPDLTPLRLQLAREPILTLKPLRQQLFTGSQLARE